MPTYEYRCSSCRKRFEVLQSMTAKPLRKCARCGKNSARRLIGAGAGLLFKGSGFYITDYRKPGYKARAESDQKKSNSTGKDAKSGKKD
ncbi:MAG: zinc ribbon domain-containing protein [Candidatus Omnitrophica bacterium]|nr:zinc ribbon domain-containing protein [Candidatus Omnitrophota bacterium]